MLKRIIFIFLILVLGTNAWAIRYKGDLETNESVTFPQQSVTPANPPATKHKLYFKNDGNVYKLNSSGTETQVDGAGGSSQWTDGGLFLRPNTNGDGMEVRDSTGVDLFQLSHDGTNAVINTNAGGFHLLPVSRAGVSTSGSLITDGLFHISSASAGIITADPGADELVLEGSANVGLSILSGNTSLGSVAFGDDGGSVAGLFGYSHAFDLAFISTQGVERARFGSTELVINDTGADVNFRVESDLNANAFFLDAGAETISMISDFEFASENSGGKLTFIGESTADVTVPAANNGVLYTKDVSGATELFFRNSSEVIQVSNAGGGGSSAPLFISNTFSGTPGTTVETVLKSYTMPADTLTVDDQGIRIQVWGSTQNNTNNKTVRIKWGGLTIYTVGPTAAQNTTFYLTIDIYRTGATAENIIGLPSSWNNALSQAPFAVDTESLTTTTLIEVTGQNGSANANDVGIRGMRVDLLP